MCLIWFWFRSYFFRTFFELSTGPYRTVPNLTLIEIFAFFWCFLGFGLIEPNIEFCWIRTFIIFYDFLKFELWTRIFIIFVVFSRTKLSMIIFIYKKDYILRYFKIQFCKNHKNYQKFEFGSIKPNPKKHQKKCKNTVELFNVLFDSVRYDSGREESP